MKEIIKSPNNNLVKIIKKLSSKKNREKLGLYVIESKKMLEEAILSNKSLKYIILREDVEDKYDNSIIIENKLFNDISTLVTPDGYMAIIEIDTLSELSDNILILDHIQDPGNMGTLIRSAEAFGFNTILAVDSVDFYNSKVLRSSMGSSFRLNLIESSYEEISKLNNYTIYIADMHGEDYRKIKIDGKIAIVIGNEGNGISEHIRKLDCKILKIPMEGKIESLNAGVSGSILMSYFRKE